MIIDDILLRLREEREFASRFPVRVIFTENFSQYMKLLSELPASCDATLNLGDYCKGDVIPDFVRLKADINNGSDRNVLLLSMSEYLRVCVKRETDPETKKFQSLWEWNLGSLSKTRVIVPLFAARELFDRCVPAVDERQRQNLWTLDAETGERESFAVTIYPPQFRGVIDGAAEGLSEWLKSWMEHLANGGASLMTRLHRYAEKTVEGVVRVEVIEEPLGTSGQPPVICVASENTVYRKNKSVTVELRFSCAVSSLEVTSVAGVGQCVSQSPNVWSVTFPNVSEKALSLSITADGKLLPAQIEIAVKTRGIVTNDELLG
ncbi:hypothetical protein FACS1894167_11470 [Synergistales bacterium]|nr:hypothetical protein FACS1894167_11470 [Synergistales bacterium]